MPRLLKTAQAEEDLDDIWFYIALDNLPAADRLIDRIVSTAWSFAEHPLSARSREDLGPGLRSFPVAAYIIFYLPMADGINIIRVLHSARDQDRAFSNEA